MGGKKPVGAMPSRGSLHRYGTSHHRRGHETGTDAYGFPPQTQGTNTHAPGYEYSLFSGLNLAHNGGHTQAMHMESGSEKGEVSSAATGSDIAHGLAPGFGLETRHRLAEIAETFVHTLCDSVGGVHPSSVHVSVLEQRIDALEGTVENLTRELARLTTTLTALQDQRSCACPTVSTDKEDSQRTHERLSTLEGRQSSIQSKISQLDGIFGPSTANWSKNVKRLKEFCDKPSKSTCTCSESASLKKRASSPNLNPNPISELQLNPNPGMDSRPNPDLNPCDDPDIIEEIVDSQTNTGRDQEEKVGADVDREDVYYKQGKHTNSSLMKESTESRTYIHDQQLYMEDKPQSGIETHASPQNVISDHESCDTSAHAHTYTATPLQEAPHIPPHVSTDPRPQLNKMNREDDCTFTPPQTHAHTTTKRERHTPPHHKKGR